MYDIKKSLIAQSPLEAVQLKEKYPDAIFVNGGTDVMIQIKNRQLKDVTVIGIRDIDEIRGIERLSSGSIRIGSGTSFVEIIDDPLLNAALPALPFACKQIGSPQIRNIATIGGNICNGAVSADSVPVLLVHNADLEIQGLKKSRSVPLSEFHLGPGQTCLSKDEILISVNIAEDDFKGYYSAFAKFGQRRAMEIATIACAAAIKLNNDKDRVADIRLALSVAAPTPIRCYATEQYLSGKEISESLFTDLRNSIVNEAKPRDSWRASKKFRIQLIKELSERTVREAILKAGGTFND